MLAARSEEGIEWVSNRLSEELGNIDSNSMEGAEKKKAAMFRNGSLAFCYRFDNVLRKTVKLKVRRNPDVVHPRYRQKHKPHGRELISMSWMGETLSDILCTTGYTRDVAHMSVL